MNEEVNRKTIAIAVKAEKLTEELFSTVINKLANYQKPLKKSKQTLNQLIEHNTPLSNLDVSGKNLRAFTAVARKYKIDFAVKKDSTEEPPKYLIFFKAKDANTVNKAFKEYAYKITHAKPSIMKSLQNARQQAQAKNKDLKREKDIDRGIQR